MDAYDRSRLAQQVPDGVYGIDRLSATYLADDRVEQRARAVFGEVRSMDDLV